MWCAYAFQSRRAAGERRGESCGPSDLVKGLAWQKQTVQGVGWEWEKRARNQGVSPRDRGAGQKQRGVTMPPRTSSWSSVRSSTTLGLREPAATRETRQQPSESSSSARLQEGRWWGLRRRGPPGARGRSRMVDKAPGRTPGQCRKTRRWLKGKRLMSRKKKKAVW